MTSSFLNSSIVKQNLFSTLCKGKTLKAKRVHKQTLPLVGVGTLPSLILSMQILILYSKGNMAD